MRPELWRCRLCRRVYRREDCTVYRGLLECGACLRVGYLDLLEPVREEAQSCASATN